MRKVKTINVGGVPNCRNGIEQNLYSFQEMVARPDYDMKQYARDKSIEETDQPVGWVVMRQSKGKTIFVEIQQYEKYEIVKEKCKGCTNCTCDSNE